MNLRWLDRSFSELSAIDVYAILALRQRVFVVEQKCAYLDADGLDPQCRHVWAEDAAGTIHAYLRIVPAGLKLDEVSIGRVIVAPEARAQKLGKTLMKHGLALCGDVPVKVSAQAYLEKFYTELGFSRVSDNYDDDGIPHLDMLRAP
jgi:ElaA protein